MKRPSTKNAQVFAQQIAAAQPLRQVKLHRPPVRWGRMSIHHYLIFDQYKEWKREELPSGSSGTASGVATEASIYSKEQPMFRKAVCAVAMMAISVGLVVAAEVRGVITKVSDDGKTITVGKFNRETKEVTDAKAYTVSSSVKVVKGKFNKEEKKLEATDVEIKGGLTGDTFKNIGKRGIFATITTDDSGNVTQIVVAQFRGKGKKKAE